MDNQYSIFPERRFEYASFGNRLLASIIDGLIVSIPVAIISFITSIDFNLINIIASWLYFAIMESGAQQATVGKKAMDIIVVSETGGRISFLNATGRHFGKIISTIILLIGYFMMLWDDRKQTLHDKMAGTLVVKGSPHNSLNL
jgi:uncharacterized RDD family membrane protein YckC